MQFTQPQSFAVFVSPQCPIRHDGKQGGSRPRDSSKALPFSGDLLPNQPKEGRQEQSCKKQGKQDRIEDEDDGTRIPSAVEWKERPDAVVVGVIEQKVA